MSMVFVFRQPGMYEHKQRKYVAGPVSSYKYIVRAQEFSIDQADHGNSRPAKT